MEIGEVYTIVLGVGRDKIKREYVLVSTHNFVVFVNQLLEIKFNWKIPVGPFSIYPCYPPAQLADVLKAQVIK